jgi:CheY-like chemotaxis protein
MQAMHSRTGSIEVLLDAVSPDTVVESHLPALRRMQARHSGRMVRMVVGDDGPGMDAATLKRVFEPFYTTKPVGQGTGLGLSVVYGIVQAHEGVIVADSMPGLGASFTLYLPASDAGPGSIQSRGVLAAAGPAPSAQAGKHVLYLDDEDSLVLLVKRLLQRRGYRVSGYECQQEALDALRADPAAFDLVVTDFNMPGMSGLDVAREVQSIRADLPVVIASGYIDDALRVKAEGAGVRDLIFKANVVEEFCDAVERALSPHFVQSGPQCVSGRPGASE